MLLFAAWLFCCSSSFWHFSALKFAVFFIILARQYNHSQVHQFHGLLVGLVSTAIIKYRVPPVRVLGRPFDTAPIHNRNLSGIYNSCKMIHRPCFTAINVPFTKMVLSQFMTLLRFSTIIFRYIESISTGRTFTYIAFIATSRVFCQSVGSEDALLQLIESEFKS